MRTQENGSTSNRFRQGYPIIFDDEENERFWVLLRKIKELDV
jgi:hypothetical protein